MMKKVEGCPKCGSILFYTKLYGRQFYTASGKPGGYEIDGETKTAWCYQCGHKIPIKRLDAARMKYETDRNCLFCKNSLSAGDEENPTLVCFECSGHEGEKVQVQEDGICKNFKED